VYIFNYRSVVLLIPNVLCKLMVVSVITVNNTTRRF